MKKLELKCLICSYFILSITHFESIEVFNKTKQKTKMWFGVYDSIQSCRLTLDIHSEWNNQISESEVSEQRSVRATKCSGRIVRRRSVRLSVITKCSGPQFNFVISRVL